MKKIIRSTILVFAVCMVLSQLDAAVYTKANTDNKVQKTKASIGLKNHAENNSGGSTFAKDSGSNLIDGMYLDGPDRIFAFQSPLILHINKKAWKSADWKDIPKRWNNGRNDIEYEWFTSDSSVASFQKTESADVYPCNVYKRNMINEEHFFSVKPGSTRIYCRITDKEGHSCTISKKMRIMRGTPIRSLKIGKWRIKDESLYSEWIPLYTNVVNEKAKVKCVPKKNWRVKRIVYNYYQEGEGMCKRDITKTKIWPVSSFDICWIAIELVNKDTRQECTINVDTKTYTVMKLPVKYKTGSGVVAYCKANEDTPTCIKVIKYRPGVSSKNENYYCSRKDLVRKMIKHYGMNPEAITVKKKKILIKIHKRSYENVLWTYARNKNELNKKSKKEYWQLKKK